MEENMSQLETQSGNANPFRLVCDLMVADEKGDYEWAVDSQRQLASLGWYVSRKPPEQPAKPKSKRRKQRQTAEQATAQ
jgi:hypothetical protein